MTTDSERAVELYQQVGNYQEVARQLGINPGNVYRYVKRWQEKEVRKGEVPEGFEIRSVKTRTDKEGEFAGQSVAVVKGGTIEPLVRMPDPKTLSRLSTNTRGDGSIIQQWTIEKVDLVERLALWKAYAEELLKPVELLSPEIVHGTGNHEDLLAVYPIGDYHVGMMAWGLEILGRNFDLKVSEQLLPQAANYLMKGAPKCKQCVLAFMGDWVHFDSFKPITPAHGYLLDADTRFGKVGRMAIRIVRNIIAAARQHHEKVHVIFLRGNHDESVAELINMFLIEFYADDPNVTIDASPAVFRYYEWGNNLFGYHHGDKTKPERMPMVMANDMREAWGRCENRYIYTGHIHHKSFGKDESGVWRESVPVLIPNDAHAANMGYRNTRKMEVVVYDRQFGEEQRHTFNSERFYRSTGLQQ